MLSERRLHALGVGQMVLWGALFYAFVPLAGPLERELGAPPAALSGLLTAALLVSAAASVPAGVAIERFGARRVLTLGSAGGALALLGAAASGSLAWLTLFFVLLGAVYAATLYEPVFALISAELPGAEARARALRRVTLWGGLASLVFVPLTTWLEGRLGPRGALALLGLLVALIATPLHASLPARGGSPRARPVAEPVVLARAPLARLVGAFALAAFASTGAAVHGMALLIEQGHSASTASVTLGLAGGMQLLGRFLYPWAAGRFGPRGLAVLGLVLQSAGLWGLPLGPAGVPLFVALFGVGGGVLTVVRPSVVEATFGAGSFVRTSSLVAACTQLARAVAPALVGLLCVWLGRRLTFVVLGLASLTGVALLGASRGAR